MTPLCINSPRNIPRNKFVSPPLCRVGVSVHVGGWLGTGGDDVT